MAIFSVVKILERRRKYLWPEAQLNFWLLVMMVAGSTILGISIYFMTVQHQVRAGQIWYESFAPLLHPPYYPATKVPWCVFGTDSPEFHSRLLF